MMPWLRGAAAILGAVRLVYAGTGSNAAGSAPAPRPGVDLSALAALGNVAFPSRGSLWIAGLGGLDDLGAGAYPVFSPSARFVARLSRRPRPGEGPVPLRIRRTDGTPVALPKLLAYQGEYFWLPGTEELLVAAAEPAGIDLVDAARGRVRTLVPSRTGALLPSFVPTLAAGPGAIAYATFRRGHEAFATRLFAQPLGRPRHLLAETRQTASSWQASWTATCSSGWTRSGRRPSRQTG